MRMSFEVTYTVNPTVKLTPRQLERLIAKRLYDRLNVERGQQSSLNIDKVTISDHDRKMSRHETF